MLTSCRALAFLVALLAFLVGLAGSLEAASDCACQDTNLNGLCDSGEPLVPQSQWIGPGPRDFRPYNFVIPETCDFLIASAPSLPIQVTAKNVYLYGDIRISGSGGQGVLFIADEDVVVGALDKPRLSWDVPGQNKLIEKQAPNAAIAKASVAFKAGRDCYISNAYLTVHPIGGGTMIGAQCSRNLTIRNSELYSAGFDLQALTGFVDAANVATPTGTTPVKWCNPEDDDTVNYPCTISNDEQLNSVCNDVAIQVPTGGAAPGINKLRAAAYPGVIVARGDIKLNSDSAVSTGQNLLEGRYAVTLISETGTVDLTNARITNTASPLSGSKIWLAAGPASVDRYSYGVMKEKFFGGCAGEQILFNTGTCLMSPTVINYCGDISASSGPSGTSPCRTDLNPVATGGF